MNNTLEGINNRITEAEEWISDLEDRKVETTATKQNTEGRVKKKNDDSLRDHGTTLNVATLSLWGSRRRRERERI